MGSRKSPGMPNAGVGGTLGQGLECARRGASGGWLKVPSAPARPPTPRPGTSSDLVAVCCSGFRAGSCPDSVGWRVRVDSPEVGGPLVRRARSRADPASIAKGSGGRAADQRHLTDGSARKVHLVVDGHSARRSKKVYDWLAAHPDGVELHFLPPYSPQLNPNELVNADLNLDSSAVKAARWGERFIPFVPVGVGWDLRVSLRGAPGFHISRSGAGRFLPVLRRVGGRLSDDGR